MEIENEHTVEANNAIDTSAEGAGEGTATETPEEPHLEAAETTEPEGETSEETPAGEESETPDGETGEEYKPNVLFKAGVYNKETKQLEQKEFTIDDKFKSIMTDPDSEKMVRELHEKANGLESVKERFQEARQFATTVSTENREIKGSIKLAQSTYQAAVKSGNWLKLDDFFQLLDIPPENIMKYALAKVELNEMDPQQRQAVLDRLDGDRHRERLQQETQNVSQENASLAQTNKSLQIDFVLGKPEVTALAAAFDERVGKAGSFKEAIYREGSLAWANEKKDLPVVEAVERVIKNYGLQGIAGAPAANASTPGQAAPKKPVVQRTTQTIPNINSRVASPLPSKPKNMEELLAYRKEQHGF